MKRGEIWTAAGPGYAGKPRPSLIVQANEYLTESVVVCGLTSDATLSETMRIPVAPGQINGLRRPSNVMVDKVTSVPRSKLVTRIGEVDGSTMREVDHALLLFLGLASSR